MALPREKVGALINVWEVSCSDDRDILCPMGRIQDVRKRNFFGWEWWGVGEGHWINILGRRCEAI